MSVSESNSTSAENHDCFVLVIYMKSRSATIDAFVDISVPLVKKFGTHRRKAFVVANYSKFDGTKPGDPSLGNDPEYDIKGFECRSRIDTLLDNSEFKAFAKTAKTLTVESHDDEKRRWCVNVSTDVMSDSHVHVTHPWPAFVVSVECEREITRETFLSNEPVFEMCCEIVEKVSRIATIHAGFIELQAIDHAHSGACYAFSVLAPSSRDWSLENIIWMRHDHIRDPRMRGLRWMNILGPELTAKLDDPSHPDLEAAIRDWTHLNPLGQRIPCGGGMKRLPGGTTLLWLAGSIEECADATNPNSLIVARDGYVIEYYHWLWCELRKRNMLL